MSVGVGTAVSACATNSAARSSTRLRTSSSDGPQEANKTEPARAVIANSVTERRIRADYTRPNGRVSAEVGSAPTLPRAGIPCAWLTSANTAARGKFPPRSSRDA